MAPPNFLKKFKICLLSSKMYIDTISATKKSKIPPANPIIPFAYSNIVSILMYSAKLILFNESEIACISIFLNIESSGMFFKLSIVF